MGTRIHPLFYVLPGNVSACRDVDQLKPLFDASDTAVEIVKPHR